MPDIVPRSDGSDDLGTSSKRWGDVYVQGDVSDGTNATSPSEIKTAYDHSQIVTGNPHSLDAADVGADPSGTASSEMGVHEATYDHTNIIEADPVGSASNAITGHLAAYDHTLIIDADPSGTASGLLATHNSTYNHLNIGNASKIQGYNVTATAPVSGDVLSWNATNNQWEPDPVSALQSVTTDTSLSGSGTGLDPLTVVDSGHDHVAADVTDLGTAATKDFPAIGNASATEVVIGTDTRLSNSRTPTAHQSTHEIGGSDQIDHDDLVGYVANEHIDHSGVSVLAGDGLTGGGTIATTRTLAVSGSLELNYINMATDQDVSYSEGRVYYNYTTNTLNYGNDEAEIALGMETIFVDVGDETTDLTIGTDKKKLRLPWNFILSEIRASVSTAPEPFLSSSSSSSSGDYFDSTGIIVDVNYDGSSILQSANKINIDYYETTSKTATTQPLISVDEFLDDDELTIDIDSVGSGVAGAGLKLVLVGYRKS